MQYVYRGPNGVLVIDGKELVRDGEPVELSEQQAARLEADPTVQLERAPARAKRVKADTANTATERKGK